MSSTSELTDEEFINKCRQHGKAGDTPEQMMNDYTEWAPKYEQDCVSHGYIGHIHIANKLCELFAEETWGKLKIIDIAAGTGVVGKQLRQKGFEHLDALDPNKAMLDEAKRRGIYEKYYYDFMTEEPLDIKENTYDALVGSACFGHEHIPVEAIREMARIVKPGGHIVVCFRSTIVEDPVEYKQYAHMDTFLKQLEDAGVLRTISKERHPQFYVGRAAQLYHLQVL